VQSLVFFTFATMKEEKRILIVDDEQDLCEILQFNLTAAGYEADVAYSAEEALEKIANAVKSSNGKITKPYNLLLLDVMMPGMSGFELAEKVKADEQTSHIPIIFLTAKDAEDDTLQGFGLGADDYVTKPFSVREVMARIQAVLKRSIPHPILKERGLIIYEGLVLDLGKKTTMVDTESVSLTKTEFDLLALLLSHPGQVFSRDELLDSVWPDDVVVSQRTVDVNVARLRKKIGKYGTRIVSRQGFGYVFEGEIV